MLYRLYSFAQGRTTRARLVWSVQEARGSSLWAGAQYRSKERAEAFLEALEAKSGVLRLFP